MAVHTNHPVAAPPHAPVRETTGHLLLRGWCIFVIASALAGTAWLMAFGTFVSGVVAVVTGVVSVVLWFVLRPGVQWRRLPWYALLYVAWALASLIWTVYPEATALTLLLLLTTTVQAMFVGSVLTWRELVRAIASALKWILALSLLLELWVSLFWHGPMLPEFVRPDPGTKYDPIVYWVRDNLFDGGRLQGVFGNANPLAYAALLGMVVFAIRFASRAPRRSLLVAWFALAAFLFVRAGSATAWLAAVAVVAVVVSWAVGSAASRPQLAPVDAQNDGFVVTSVTDRSDVLARLAELGFGDVEEVTVVDEHLQFALPAELRRELRAAGR